MLIKLLKSYWLYILMLVICIGLYFQNTSLVNQIKNMQLKQAEVKEQSFTDSVDLYQVFSDKEANMSKDYDYTNTRIKADLFDDLSAFSSGANGLQYNTRTYIHEISPNLSKDKSVCPSVQVEIPSAMAQDIRNLRASIEQDDATIRYLQGRVIDLERIIDEYNLKGK